MPSEHQAQRGRRRPNNLVLYDQMIPNDSALEDSPLQHHDVEDENSMKNKSHNNNINNADRLDRLGWKPYFAKQLALFRDIMNNDKELLIPVRITEVHNQGICIVGVGEGGIENELIPNIPPKLQQEPIQDALLTSDTATIASTITTTQQHQPLVGDWILINERKQIMAILNRRSLLQRRAPGRGQGGKIQKMAANVDTVFVVSSCNQDFNVARLERYVAMVLEAANQHNSNNNRIEDENKKDTTVTPVIVLTKRDQWDGVDEDESMVPYYVAEAQDILARRQIPVVLLDARGAEPAEKLKDWIQPGQTVAFLGSSGVGKSTLVNSLCGDTVAKTGDIHEDSGQGRHTTTRRQLHFLADSGCAIMDTPGLRELQLIQASKGVAEVFADLVEISRGCAFRDCKHAGEPGCAIEAAIDNDEIDCERVARWQKLVQEEELNMKTMTEHERRRKGGGGEPSSRKKSKKKCIPKSQQKKNKKYRNRLER